jgi:hypothetical protein
MKTLISFDERIGLDPGDFVSEWNIEHAEEAVASVEKATDTFNADWLTYLGGAGSAVSVAIWLGVPTLKDLLRSFFPARKNELEHWDFKEARKGDITYILVIRKPRDRS